MATAMVSGMGALFVDHAQLGPELSDVKYSY